MADPGQKTTETKETKDTKEVRTADAGGAAADKAAGSLPSRESREAKAKSRANTALASTDKKERGAKFGDAKKPGKNDVTNSTNVKVWIKFRGPDGEDHKVMLNRGCMQFELRKVISAFTGVPPREVNIQVNGKELKEAREPAFVDFDPKNDVVLWYRKDRMKSIMATRKIHAMDHLDKFERSLVHFTVIDGDTELTQEVLDHKDFDMRLMNKRDIFGDTGLMLASIQGYTDLVELLLDRQAGLEYQNIYGRTALMMAAEHGHHEVVRSLLRAGATTEPNPGTTRPDALSLARSNTRYKVIKAVKQHKIELEAAKELEAEMAAAGFD